MTKNDFIDILKAEFEEDKRNMLLENDEQEYTIKQAIIDYAEESEFDDDELEELAKYPNILQALYNIFPKSLLMFLWKIHLRLQLTMLIII